MLRHELCRNNLLESIEKLSVIEYFLRRKLLVLHRVEDEFEALFVAGLIGVILCLIGNLSPLVGFDSGKYGCHGRKGATHGDEGTHYLYVDCDCP